MMDINFQSDYDVAQYILENGGYIRENIEPMAIKFWELKSYFDDGVFIEEFNTRYHDFFTELMVRELVHPFPNLTYEDLRSIVTPDFVMELLGLEYFEYE